MIRRLVLLAALALWLPACATTNVRAMRAYAYEDANFLIALDRIEDVAEVLRLLDEVMTTLPYSPGDDWVDQLALSDERAEEMKSAIVNRPPYDDDEFSVPIVKLYRFHLGDVVRKVRKAKREEEPAYDSLLDAMKDLSTGTNLVDQWKTYQGTIAELAEAEEKEAEVRAKYAGQLANRQTLPPDLVEAQQEVKDAEAKVMMASTRLANSVKAVRQADLRGGPRKQIAADALTAFSVALRVDLEALALIPFAVTNMVRSAGDAPAALLANIKSRHAFKAVDQLSDLPRLAVTIEEQLERQLALTQEMTDALAALTSTELGETAGFMLQESVVDQIVGITLDSFHADLKVDAEVFFFSQLGGDETRVESEDSEGNTTVTDYTGRTRRLEYEVAPIWMLGVQLNAGFDWIKLPNVGSLKAGFATDRVFSQGGQIETSNSLADQLGLEGFASDIFDLGLGVLGVRTNVKMATFNFGYVSALEVDPTDGDDQGIAEDADGNREESNFQLKYTQIDVGYDIAFLVYEWASRYYVEEFWLGYRYFDYRLPRVLYEMEGESDKTFVRQSPAQNLDATYHMGGLRLRMGPGGAPRFHPYGDLGLYFGAGPAAYYFCEGDTPEARTCTEEPRSSDKDEYIGSMMAVNLAFALGLRLRLTPKRWPLMAHVGLQYTGELVFAGISQEQEGSDENRSIDLGSSEIFHGPQLQLRGEL